MFVVVSHFLGVSLWCGECAYDGHLAFLFFQLFFISLAVVSPYVWGIFFMMVRAFKTLYLLSYFTPTSFLILLIIFN